MLPIYCKAIAVSVAGVLITQLVIGTCRAHIYATYSTTYPTNSYIFQIYAWTRIGQVMNFQVIQVGFFLQVFNTNIYNLWHNM